MSGTDAQVVPVNGDDIPVQEEVIALDDSDGEEQKKDGVMQGLADSSVSDSLLVAAAEMSESYQSSSYIPASNNNYKKIHMDIMDCKDLASSHPGAEALTNPSGVVKSSKDPNRGMYPRPSFRKDASLTGSFVPASALHNGVKRQPSCGQNYSVKTMLESQTLRPSPKKQRTGLRLPYQNNSLDRYFSASQPSASSTPNMSSTPPKRYTSSQGSPSSTPSLRRSPPSYMYSPLKQVAGSNLFTVSTGDGANKYQDGVTRNLFNKQKSQHVPRKTSKSTKSKKPTPTFNRGNSFLYSNDPIPKSTTSKAKDLYGLLGNGHLLPDDPDGNHSGKHINDFPNEILENILCRLPMADLCLNVNRVCTLWRDIIADKRVSIEWYLQLNMNTFENIFHLINSVCKYVAFIFHNHYIIVCPMEKAVP